MSNSERSEMREQLADLAHQQWSGWMHYLFSKCDKGVDGTLIIPAWAVERWQRQMTLPYSQLDVDEQESDRKEADKFIELIEQAREID